MISICFNSANLYSFLQGLLMTIFPKAINSTLTIQEIPRPTVYRIVVQTLRTKFFNLLGNEVINSQSLSSFKKKLKIKLLSK